MFMARFHYLAISAIDCNVFEKLWGQKLVCRRTYKCVSIYLFLVSENHHPLNHYDARRDSAYLRNTAL